MDALSRPSPVVVGLSAFHVLFLLAIPVLANFTVVPTIIGTWRIVVWFFFGLLIVPIAFAGMLALNPFPRTFLPAVLRALLLPVVAGVWWLYQDGTVTGYFTAMLVFEFLAVFCVRVFYVLSASALVRPGKIPRRAMCGLTFLILAFQGFVAAGGFACALIVALWPWFVEYSLWRQPFTYLILFLAAVELIVANFRWHRVNSDRLHGPGKRPTLDETVSIEAFLLLAPVPWLISFLIVAV